MLFKTLSASVYGIDAYLVEVEVDVGSAHMNDFNVVGLPDNAVKESRERIKAAMRNCSYEFPHGQGVTINLAPADVRKEGSGIKVGAKTVKRQVPMRPHYTAQSRLSMRRNQSITFSSCALKSRVK